MIYALFYVVTRYVVVIPFRRFGADTLSRNASKELPKHPA